MGPRFCIFAVRTQYVLMHRMWKTIPVWVKILGGLLVLSMAVSLIAAFSVAMIPTVLIVSLMLVPCKDKKNPYLFRAIPYLWILGFVVALVFVGADFAGKELLDADAHKPTPMELWSTIAFTPPLLWALWQRNRFFMPLLFVSTALFIGIDVNEYASSLRDAKAALDFFGNFSAQVLLTGYLFTKFKAVQ